MLMIVFKGNWTRWVKPVSVLARWKSLASQTFEWEAVKSPGNLAPNLKSSCVTSSKTLVVTLCLSERHVERFAESRLSQGQLVTK